MAYRNQEVPRLTDVGAWRYNHFDGRPHGGFYGQEDLREIAAYPHLGGRSNPDLVQEQPVPVVRTSWGISEQILLPTTATLEFFTDVFDEVMKIFPGPLIGLSCDQVPP